MLLPNERIAEIKQAFQDALLANNAIYDGQTRLFLARGMTPYLLTQAVVGAPGFQLDLDLTNFNNVERLTDGTAPLEVWLRNAINFIRLQTQAATLQMALDDVSRILSGAPRIEDLTPPPDLPVGSLPSGLEKTIHRDDSLPFHFIEGAGRVGRSVAKLSIPKYELGQIKLSDAGTPIIYLGTGWLIKSDLLITNWHVVNAREDNQPPASQIDLELQSAALTAQFDYDSDSVQGLSFKAARLEASDVALDFALVRLREAVGNRQSLMLSAEQLNVQGKADYKAVNIIQHPGGRAKRVAIRNNLIYQTKYPTVTYFTDTDSGSSGSPVCDDGWKVVALHRAWKAVKGVQFQGLPTPWINEGTQITAILEYLQNNHAALYSEITGN